LSPDLGPADPARDHVDRPECRLVLGNPPDQPSWRWLRVFFATPIARGSRARVARAPGHRCPTRRSPVHPNACGPLAPGLGEELCEYWPVGKLYRTSGGHVTVFNPVRHRAISRVPAPIH